MFLNSQWNMKKIYLFTLVIMLATGIHSRTLAQGPGFDVPKIEDLVKIPPSPEAQAFSKYGNTPARTGPGWGVWFSTAQKRDETLECWVKIDRL